MVVASTHLEPLKGFASTHPRARNASVEFDPERLAPTFRLIYDRPGQSYALSIGARLGLPAALIERAHAHRSIQQRQLQELLARLDDRDRKDAERGALLERREAESAGLLARAQAELEAAKASARETVARAKAEAQRLVTEVRRHVNEEWDRLKRSEKSRPELERARKRLVATAQQVEHTAGVARLSRAGRAGRRGRSRRDHASRAQGDVLGVDGETVTVQAGTVTVKVPMQALRVIQRRPSVRCPLAPAGGEEWVRGRGRGPEVKGPEVRGTPAGSASPARARWRWS